MVLQLREKKIVKVGNSYGIIIGKEHIRNKDIFLNKKYNITFREVD